MKRITLAILLITVLILAACNNEAEEEETIEIDTPVQVETVVEKDFEKAHTYFGRTMPSDQMPVMVPSPGEVDELHVDRGDTVEEEDVIATIVSPQMGTIEIEAPMSGIIQELNMQEERPVSPEEPVAIVIANDPIVLAFQIPATDRELFEVDETVEVSIASANLNSEATITYIASSAEENGMFQVEAEITDESDMPIGVMAQVSVVETVESNALVVPTNAVLDVGSKHFVYKVEDDVAYEVEVEVVAMHSDETAIKPLEEGTLQAGTEVVTRGVMTIGDEQRIQIIEEDE